MEYYTVKEKRTKKQSSSIDHYAGWTSSINDLLDKPNVCGNVINSQTDNSHIKRIMLAAVLNHYKHFVIVYDTTCTEGALQFAHSEGKIRIAYHSRFSRCCFFFS